MSLTLSYLPADAFHFTTPTDVPEFFPMPDPPRNKQMMYKVKCNDAGPLLTITRKHVTSIPEGWTADDYYNYDDDRKSQELDILALAPPPAPPVFYPLFTFRGYGYIRAAPIIQALTRGFIARRQCKARAVPSIFADVHPLPLQPVSLDELFPVVHVDTQPLATQPPAPCVVYVQAEPAADVPELVPPGLFGERFAFDGLAPTYVYKFDVSTYARRLGKAQAAAMVYTKQNTGDAVRVIRDGVDPTQPVAVLLYHHAVVYINIRVANNGKRVHGLMLDRTQATRSVELNRKGFETWHHKSMAAAVLAW